MNILASYNWMKEYVNTSMSPEEFAREMSLKSMSIESIDRLKDRFDGLVIGLVKEVKAHPDADKLRIAVTDIGESVVEIVCGGVNLEEGMRVLVGLPGAKVRWHGEGDLVELKETKIRGVKSYGMICAPSEVGFEKAPCLDGGIWDLTDLVSAEAGTSFVDAFDMDDVLFDIEVTTNRPDAMNIVGLAREAGAALEQEFTWKAPELPAAGTGKELTVSVEDTELCSRYMAVVIDGVKVGPSPLWMQQKLLHAGYRPINNIVDITNYILHEYGQPLHAFDYDQLHDQKIVVRKAKKGEVFLALDDNEYELNDGQLVVADGDRAVAVAGVMGGKDSGTWNETKTIVLEAATFDAVSVRRTARGLNLYSQSQSMFEKGLSTESPAAALARAVELALEIAGGEVASDVFDVRSHAYEPKSYALHPQKVVERIGVEISEERMIDMLERLGFSAQKNGEEYQVTVPYWRDHDIEGSVDFTEEIARLYGYEEIPSVLPSQAPPTTVENPVIAREAWMKNLLKSAGYTEFYGYSFTSAEDLARYDLDPKNAVRIYNELTMEQTHLRTSLMPSVLRSIEQNQGQVACGDVFELQNVYIPQVGDLPEERLHLVIAKYGASNAEEALLGIKGVLEYMMKKTGRVITFSRDGLDARWHETRSVSITIDGETVGILGQVSHEVQEAFGLDVPVIAASLNISNVIREMIDYKQYIPASDFPSVERDVAVMLDRSVEFSSVKNALKEIDQLVREVILTDVYTGEGIEEGKKSVTFRITLQSDSRTLESDEVEKIMTNVQNVLSEKFNGTIR